MKKEYTKPQADITEVQPLAIMQSSSVNVGGGTTNEQNAPTFDGVEWSWE